MLKAKLSAYFECRKNTTPYEACVFPGSSRCIGAAQSHYSGMDNLPGNGIQGQVGLAITVAASGQQGQVGHEMNANSTPSEDLHSAMEMDS